MRFNYMLLNSLLNTQKERGIKPTHLSAFIGASNSLISSLRKGKVKDPKFSTVIKLVKYFKVNYQDFILEE